MPTNKKTDNFFSENQSEAKTLFSIVLIAILLFIFEKPLFEIFLLKDSGLLKSLIKFDFTNREWAIFIFWIVAFIYAFLFTFSLKEKKLKRNIVSLPVNALLFLFGIYYCVFFRNDMISVGNFNFYLTSFEKAPFIRYTDIFFASAAFRCY